MIWTGCARQCYRQLLSESESTLNSVLPACQEESESKSQLLVFILIQYHMINLHSSAGVFNLTSFESWWGCVPTYPPGASRLHLIHINCEISSPTKCVKLDVSCHTLYLDLPGTKKKRITPVSNIQQVSKLHMKIWKRFEKVWKWTRLKQEKHCCQLLND